MPTHLANTGYLAMSKETTKGVLAATPSIYVPMYDANFETDVQIDEDSPIIGNKFARYRALLGQRAHKGEVTVLAEPNTTSHLLNMILTKGTTVGAGDPYTHPFTLDNTTDPKSYSIDIAKGNIVTRFLGVEIAELGNDFDKNKMVWKVQFSALKSFSIREVDEVTGLGPYTIHLKTNYDPKPTDGLAIGDIMTLYKAADGTTINFAVASIVNDTDITCVADVSTGLQSDLIYLRPATPTYSLKSPFMWALTEYHFANNVADALSAAQLRVEQGSTFNITHKFEDEAGAARSGSFDPAALVRTVGDVELETKVFFDDPKDLNWFLTAQVRAMAIKCTSEDGKYSFTLKVYGFSWKEAPVKVKSGEVLYVEGKQVPVYSTSDGKAFDVSVINAVASAAH